MSAAPGPGGFPALPEQQAIQAAVMGTSNVLIEAGAGCGKTSTLEWACSGLRRPALALAFNKSIQMDMVKKFPRNFAVKTMNGLGHGAWMRGQGLGSVELDARKLGKLVTQVSKDEKVDITTDQWETIRRTVEKAMQRGLVLDGDRFGHQSLVEDTPETWISLAVEAFADQDEAEMIALLARQTLEQSVALARSGTISFDDQIYCSVMLGGQFTPYPVVVVDEDQDLSMLNHLMVAKCLRGDSRLIAVGDKHQAIYGFRGAHGDSAEQLRLLRPEDSWTELPLMTTFRCPQSVVSRQHKHVPLYRAGPNNPQGLVASLWDTNGEGEQLETWSWSALQARVEASKREGFTKARPRLAVLCRNNAPLLRLAFKLIRQGVGVVMLGRDIGKGLETLAKKVCPEGSAVDCVRAVEQWRSHEIGLIEANGRGGREGVNDRADCLLAVLESGSVRDAGQLRSAIRLLFDRTEGLITLGSIHRSKGLEWDFVLHLDPWRVPSSSAKSRADQGDRRELEQELNLKYVCETRTRFGLLFGNVEDFQ